MILNSDVSVLRDCDPGPAEKISKTFALKIEGETVDA
jgi:hypothetical protein